MPVPFGVELFAGGGGLAEGLRLAAPDLRVVGLEWDHAACRTRVANGHPTIRTDVAAYPTAPFAGVRLVAGGPPCQPFSMTGKGEGRRHLAAIGTAAAMVADGLDPAEAVRRVADDALDFRTTLVLQPLRWVRDLRPAAVLLEQVPPVLPVWEAIAVHMRRLGYRVWTGKVSAEQYGVGQTRIRSLLLGRLDGPVGRPLATHRAYRRNLPDRGRYAAVGTWCDDGLEPWVSLGDVLGLADDAEVVSNYGTGGDSSKRGRRRATEPAATVTSEVSRNRVLRNNNTANAAVRTVDEPAPTIYFGARANAVTWEPDAETITPVSEGSRVSVEEAALLQSFRPGRRWCGTLSEQYEQVGNAVPPLLAAHAAAVVLGLPVPKLETPRIA